MRLLALAILLASSTAFACPNLSGPYPVCRSLTGNTSGPSDLVVTQTIRANVTWYTLNYFDMEMQEAVTETYRADGKPLILSETDPETGMSLKQTTTVTCAGNIVKAKIVLVADGQTFATLNSEYFKKGNQLHQNMNGMIMGQAIKDTIICE